MSAPRPALPNTRLVRGLPTCGTGNRPRVDAVLLEWVILPAQTAWWRGKT